jgi:hypothetical protein
MHKVKMSNRLDLIDCWGVQSAVALYLYKGGGLDPLPTDFRVNPAVLGNKSHEKLGTLTDSAHARTVRATTADSPDRRPSAPPPRTVRTADRPTSGSDRPHGHFGFQHSACTSDSPMNYSGGHLYFPMSGWLIFIRSWCTGHCLVAHRTVRCAILQHTQVFCSVSN